MGFRIVYADITQLKVDAIVNSTDRWYSGGGGEDEQIHMLCGMELYYATRKLPMLHLGEAKATEGFALPCKYIIHTSGPKWRESHFLEISLLGSCYRNSVQLAHSLGCKSIAFPLISSHHKHFPKQQALQTAIGAIMECVDEYPDMEIILTIYGEWTETIPASFFEELSEYLADNYEPEEDFEPDREMNLEIPDSVSDIMAAEEIRLEGVRAIDPSLIEDLLDNPSQKNLDKVEIDENFAQMLNRLIDERGTKTSSILDALGISNAALYKLRHGINNPSKLTVFALAIFFELSIEQTEEMLMKAGFAINPSSVQDLIVSGLIRGGIYDRYRIDELLYSLDLQLLPGAIVD